MRTAKTVMNELRSGHFMSHPGDMITVVEHKGVISNTVDLRLTNDDDATDCRLCVSNVIDTWKWLLRINDTMGRCVVVEKDGEFVPFLESLPYKSRKWLHK